MGPRRKEELLHTVKMLVFPKLGNLLGLGGICLGHSHPSLCLPPPPLTFLPFVNFTGDAKESSFHASASEPVLHFSLPTASFQLRLVRLLSGHPPSLRLQLPKPLPLQSRPIRSSSDRWDGGVWGEKGRLEITLGQPECGRGGTPKLQLPACPGARKPRPAPPGALWRMSQGL